MSDVGNKEKVLVVDDVAENIHILMNTLSERYSVVPARNGPSALRKAAMEPPPDLILLDIMMPDMDGFEVCRRLKEREETRDIPVIFLTAMTDHESEIKGLELGGADYIRKPFFPPMVLTRIAAHLQAARSRRILAEKNAILEERNAALRENERLRDDIQRITQHDLKGPLTILMRFPELMLEEPNITDEQKTWMKHMIRAGRDMLDLINRSLDLYKMETGCYDYQPHRQNIVGIVQQVASGLDRLARQYGVHIRWTVSGSRDPELAEIDIHLDRMLTFSMLTNLCKNAVEAAPEGGTIDMTVEKSRTAVTIGIHNQGAVPESIRERFFDKYITAGKRYGTGLGTYSARLMARTQNGEITMRTDEERGTTVEISLPLLDAAARDRPPKRESPAMDATTGG